MTFFLCELWPYLAGGLIGWLLAGWFARHLKYVEPPIEKIIKKEVEVVVDNPEHLELISKLKSENSKISSFMSSTISDDQSANLSKTKVVEKVIEKIIEIDNPVQLARIKQLEDELNTLKSGKTIDLKAARAAGISINSENDLTAIEGIEPKINELIQADGITTFQSLSDTSPKILQKTLDKAGLRYKMVNPGTWPDQANLAVNNRWPALKALQDVLVGGVYPDGSTSSTGSPYATESDSNNKKESISNTPKAKKSSITVPKLDADAAKAAGFELKQKNGQDDFTLIEGIGPKINELIHAVGIHSFQELSETLVADIQTILDDAGSNYRLAKPGTWPAQAEMAATNRWGALKAWQDELDGGK